MMSDSSPTKPPDKPRAYVPAVGPGLKKLLAVVFALFAILAINSGYLAAVTFAEWYFSEVLQNYFYQSMFLVHLVLGLLITVPVIVFGVIHSKNTYKRRNRRAVRAGFALFAASLLLLASGIVLTRVEGILEIKDGNTRDIVYWTHVLAPLVVIWLFILHRLAGPRIRWKVGGGWALVVVAFAAIMLAMHSQDPREWGKIGPASGEKYFFPSLARTVDGNFIPATTLQMDQYCLECHPDVHRGWSHSVHRFSSFNNPIYLFSVRNTRKAMIERDGNVQGSRFCAGCHDPVPFFSGAFDDPDFDDEKHPTSQAGVTCSVCHSITHINDNRGNASYTIEEPLHYPFTFSENPFLQWVNRQLVKAKPAFHKKTFLKPLHQTTEFCGTCHKVHLPEELNQYRFLRGQNHYDSFLLSGVSGHGVSSFYYPPKAEKNCNGCHMPLQVSDDFGAKVFADGGELSVHNHQFPTANTAIPELLGMPPWVNEAHREFLDGVTRVDIFALRKEGTIDGELIAPLRPELPTLEPGGTYLLEAVIRTLKLGHLFTQGTADSNEIWLEVKIKSGDRLVGLSGGLEEMGRVDPWSHFVNAYVLDGDGNRIDRRNPEDIFVPLYNHQIPPGAADSVHYRFKVPEDIEGPLTIDVALKYRKFDTTIMQHVYGREYENTLPITVMATDSVTLPVGESDTQTGESSIPLWQRWNDYGIGLLRKGSKGSKKGQLRQAEEAFQVVEALGRPDGALNLARVYFKEGRLEEAVAALERAGQNDPPAPSWTLAWFTGLVNKQNGRLDAAIESFQSIVETKFRGAAERDFDFSKDYRVLNELGQTLVERSKLERGVEKRARRDEYLLRAKSYFEKALAIDPENVAAHFNMALIHNRLGDMEKAKKHRNLHGRYKPDDNAGEKSIAKHRAANKAADHASESIVIYDLQREAE